MSVDKYPCIFSCKMETIVYIDLWVIDQVPGQDGWILAPFLFCVFEDGEGAWSITDLILLFLGNLGIQQAINSVSFTYTSFKN